MTDPEQLAPGVYRIDAIAFSHAISVFAIRTDGGWMLVDTGLSSSPKRIQAALAKLGVTPDALAGIYLTHHHQDHIGGLPGMRSWAPAAEILAPRHEAEIIAGERHPDASASRVFKRLQRWIKLPVVPVTRTVSEGDMLAGFRVLATPGHSLGHTSLLSAEHGLLLTADAFGALPRKLRVGVRRALCADPAMAAGSAEKLLGEDYSTVAVSHGPVMRAKAKDRLRRAVQESRQAQ